MGTAGDPGNGLNRWKNQHSEYGITNIYVCSVFVMLKNLAILLKDKCAVLSERDAKYLKGFKEDGSLVYK